MRMSKRSGDSRSAELEARRGGGADAGDHLEQHARAVVEAAAVAVAALVVLGIQELRQQVAVRAVQLHALEAGLFGAAARRR